MCCSQDPRDLRIGSVCCQDQGYGYLGYSRVITPLSTVFHNGSGWGRRFREACSTIGGPPLAYLCLRRAGPRDLPQVPDIGVVSSWGRPLLIAALASSQCSGYLPSTLLTAAGLVLLPVYKPINPVRGSFFHH